MRIDEQNLTSSAKLAWQLFKETGEIGYYLLYVQLRDEI